MRRLLIVGAGLAAAGFAAWKLRVEPWYRDWGHDPDEAVMPLPGDDLVADPSVIDTRGLDIAAPPARVWPWLVQLGYGRAGWYSYDQMDMKGTSATEILPEFQTLAEGDIVPVAPGSGFRAAVVDPGHALVLYLDGDLVKQQAEAAKAAATSGAPVDELPTNLKAGGAAMGATFPADFAASWAMVLEPLGTDRTRMITRFRVTMGEGTPATRAAAPFFGFGVFAMTRKQMLGIRDRAEAGSEAPGTEGAELQPV